jgi:thiol-disulfide isomerase/thioredoxin
MGCGGMECLFATALAFAAGASSNGQNVSYDHFAGSYAFAATPHWVAFEITRSGTVFSVRTPDQEKFADLQAADGALVGEDAEGRELALRREPANDRYVLAGTTQLAAADGMRNVAYKWALVKAVPVPGATLEAQAGVEAATLVRRVRERERWLDQCRSLRFTADITQTNTLAGMEHRKKEIQAQHPDADLSRERFWGLAPVQRGTEELCLDRRRFRLSKSYENKYDQVELWDGQTFTSYQKHYTHEQESYFIEPKLGNRGVFLLSGFAWPRSQPPRHWWTGPARDNIDPNEWFGRPEEFVLVGTHDYRGVSCHVLERERHGDVQRWYVGVQDGLLHGSLSFQEGQLAQEFWTDGYRQVQPGWWFPMSQGYHHFSYGDDLQYFVASRRDIAIRQVEVNEELPEKMFQMEFREGVRVTDARFGGLVTYRYKKDMTEQEWEKIREQAVQRAERDAADKRDRDARLGLEPPAFPTQCQWLHTTPLNWQALRGKVVVLQFWGRWCGPCHNYIRFLKAPKSDDKIVLIGIHTPDDELDAVRETLAKYGADGPVCVDLPPKRPDTGFGFLSSWFGVQAIPSWFIIGPDGRIAGHSLRAEEAFRMAGDALPAAGKEKGRQEQQGGPEQRK